MAKRFKEPALKPKSVVRDSKRVMLFMPPKAKRAFEEISFKEERKEHSVYIEALREYLERRGFKSPSLWKL